MHWLYLLTAFVTGWLIGVASLAFLLEYFLPPEDQSTYADDEDTD